MKKEEKRERFTRLATMRTNEVLKRLKVLSNCGNRSAYEYADDEVAKIFSAIEKAMKDARSKFHSSTRHGKFEL